MAALTSYVMGGENDGGYLVPDDLEGIEYCFSPGVSNIATFELDCLNRGSFLSWPITL